jgi:hypothetical protein
MAKKISKKPEKFQWARAKRLEHSADCVRIRQVLENLGFVVTLADCQKIWAAYSKTQEGKPDWWPLPMTYGALKSKLVYNVLPETTGVNIA